MGRGIVPSRGDELIGGLGKLIESVPIHGDELIGGLFQVVGTS